MQLFKIMSYHFNLNISGRKTNLTIMARMNVTQSFFSFLFYSKTYELSFISVGVFSFDLLLLYSRCAFYSTYRNSHLFIHMCSKKENIVGCIWVCSIFSFCVKDSLWEKLKLCKDVIRQKVSCTSYCHILFLLQSETVDWRVTCSYHPAEKAYFSGKWRMKNFLRVIMTFKRCLFGCHS